MGIEDSNSQTVMVQSSFFSYTEVRCELPTSIMGMNKIIPYYKGIYLFTYLFWFFVNIIDFELKLDFSEK